MFFRVRYSVSQWVELLLILQTLQNIVLVSVENPPKQHIEQLGTINL